MGRRSRHLSFKSLFFKSLSLSQWPWPSCKQPRTLSFRLANYDEREAVVVDDDDDANLTSTDSCFTMFSSAAEPAAENSLLTRAMSSSRLIYDGGHEWSPSITEERRSGCRGRAAPFEGSVAVEVESEDLYRDFRVSMTEMVEASGEEIGRKELGWFEEMLEWYLRMNKRWTHEYIIGAYWDLLLDRIVGPSSSSCCCCCSAGGSFSFSSSSRSTCSSLSSYVSCLSEIEEAEEEGGEEASD